MGFSHLAVFTFSVVFTFSGATGGVRCGSRRIVLDIVCCLNGILGLCLGWKGQLIRCVTRREGGRVGGREGRGGEGGREGGREEGGRGGRERGGRGGREGRADCYTYYSDGSTIFI